jgi:hypothetical protein
MNKKLVIGITFLSIFILIGVGYQPIVAENQINDVKESYVSVNKITKLNNLFIRLVKMRLQTDEDCDCDITFNWSFPIICAILFSIVNLLGFITWPLPLPILENWLEQLFIIGYDLNCYWWHPPL